MSQVTAVLERLVAGTITLDDVARDFAARQWPAPRSVSRRQADALADADPEPITEGSFAEVESAYINGVITEAQYAVLAEAAARAM